MTLSLPAVSERPVLAARPAPGDRRAQRTALLAVAALTILGTVLRLYRLGDWGLEGDEIFTLRDSLVPTSLLGPKPLLFVLNHYVVAPWIPLDELGLRILPAVFGVLAVPTLYWLGCRMLSPGAGLLAALLVAVHPWHVYWSQFARYYSLVFLLSGTAVGVFFVGVRRRDARWIVAAAVCAALAVLAHPSAALLAGGVGVWFLFSYRDWLPRLRAARGLTLALGCLLVIAALAGIFFRLVPTFAFWQARGHNWGHRGPALVLSYLDWVSAGLALCAGAGFIWMWKQGERSLVVLLASIVVVPLTFLVAASSWISVSTGYLFATAPALFLAAGFLLERVLRVGRAPWQARLVSVTCLTIIVSEGAPRLLSHYRDGSRLDLRSAAGYVAQVARPEDLVIADQRGVVAHYLTRSDVGGFVRDPSTLAKITRDLRPEGALWIISTQQRRGGFNDLDLGAVAGWVRRRCELARVFARPRLDYKHNEVGVYRCQAGGPAAQELGS